MSELRDAILKAIRTAHDDPEAADRIIDLIRQQREALVETCEPWVVNRRDGGLATRSAAEIADAVIALLCGEQ